MAIRTHPMPVSTTPQQHNLLQLPGKLAKKSEAIRKGERPNYKLFFPYRKRAGIYIEYRMWPLNKGRKV